MGMVGSAIWRTLYDKGYRNIIGRTSYELDLRNQAAVNTFFEKEKPEFVFLAAAKVGGIHANNKYRADFIYDNLQIQNNIIYQSYIHKVKKLLFLGSSCIYPKNCPQPIKEEFLLSGKLEETNEPYAIAKISGIKMCENFNRQYGTNFISVMPTNLYGDNDNYDLETSHVIPALLRKIYLGKCLGENNWNAVVNDLNKNPISGINGSSSKKEILNSISKFGINVAKNRLDSKNGFLDEYINQISVSIWGDGSPFREFLHTDDLAEACVFLMENYNFYDKEILPDFQKELIHSFVNIGTGQEISIKKLAELIKDIIGFKGKLKFDKSKPNGTPRKLLDVSKLSKMGWESKINLESGIKSLDYFE